MENQEHNEFGYVTPLSKESRLKEDIEKIQAETVGMEINKEGHLVKTLSSDEMLKEKLDAKQVELLSAEGEEKEAIEKEIEELEIKLGLKNS